MGATASNLFGGGARSPKRLRRASDLPAIQSVEDLFPPEVFFKTVAGGYLEAEEIGNVACANRQFKETSYNPRMTTGRGCVALIGQGCSPSVPEAKKWFKIAAELHGTREALIFLGEWASGGTTSLMKFFVRSRSADPVDPVEAETLFRAAVAADDSPSESYCIFAPAGHALDVARVGLATMLKRGGDEMLVEAANLLDAVLDHDNIPATQQQMRRPNSEARALRAEIILQQQAPGALAEALELVEAIPAADLEGIEGSNCAYVLGKIYKALDEETPNDEHARRAFLLLSEAMGEGHPRAAFDVGQMAERGRGTPAHLLTAYTSYLMAAMRPVPDERAVARLREVIAAGPPLPMELMLAHVRVRQFNAQADEVIQGNATFEQAMEHMNDPNQTLALLGIPAVDPAPQ